MKDDSNRVVPCAPSKILVSNIVSLRPNAALVPFGFQTRSRTELLRIGASVSKLIPTEAVEAAEPVKITCEQAVAILSAIEPALTFDEGYAFDWEAVRAAVEYYSKIASPPGSRGGCWLYVDTGRTMSRKRAGGRFSDAPLSYQERAAFRSLADSLPILALLQQDGREEDGWRRAPFWWPVLVAPAKSVPSIFATSVRESETTDDDED